MPKAVKTYLQDENGATAIEYGLIASIIAVAIMATVFAIGADGVSTFETIRTYIM